MALQNYLDPVSLCLSSEVEQQTQELANVGQINTSGVVDVMARGMHLLWKTTWTL
jgi:hypothetical protein